MASCGCGCLLLQESTAPTGRVTAARARPEADGYPAGTASKDCEPEQFTNQILFVKMSYLESK